jgi:hypothetical protein
MNCCMKKFSGLALLFCASSVFGQSTEQVSAVIVPDSLVGIYKKSLGVSLPLYNGRQFYGYPASFKEHAFYPVNEWSTGSILFDNMWYNNVPVMYDVYKDEVVVMHPNGVPFVLFSDRVQEFSLRGHVFVRLFAAKDKIATGFYERLSTGKATIFAKRVKLLDEKIIGLEIERKFIIKDMFYVQKDKLYTRINKQQSLLSVLKDKHGELQQYIKQSRIRFKAGPETYITQVAEFYNKLYR